MLCATIIVAVTAASAGVWYGIFNRWRAGRPVIPLARRRPVPWLGRDVLFIMLLALLLPYLALIAVNAVVGGPAANEIAGREPEMSHPAEQLLRSGNWKMMALAIVLAVIVAPVCEEFLFRVLLQGWLEAVWTRQRRKHRDLRAAPLSWLPILLPALLFARMHYRTAQVPLSLHYLADMMLGHTAAELAALGLALAYLRFGVGATAADLGWQPRKWAADAKLAIIALLAVLPPLFLLQGWLVMEISRAGIHFAPDPIPLFFLALVFGVLYQRTHRIAPSLLMHAAFNATSIAMLFVGFDG